MKLLHRIRGTGSGMGRALVPGAAAFAVVLAGCETDSLVNLEDPDLITLPTVQDTANIETLRNGVLFEFAEAYSGPANNNATPGIVGVSGLMADELWYASTFSDMRNVDARAIQRTDGAIEDVFFGLHRARNLANQADAMYAQSSRQGSADHAMMVNYSAFASVLLAENFCSGVPVSEAPLGEALVFGASQTTDEILNGAIARFDEAIALAQGAGSDDQLNLARVGKARALLALGRFDDAAAVAAAVPDDFEFAVTYADVTTASNNGVYYNINSEGRSSAATNEGTNGLTFFTRGAGPYDVDPRVEVDSAGIGIGTSIPRYIQLKYPARGSDIVLASGLEARLIEAEAALDMGNSTAYLPILNDLRTDIGLPALTDPGAGEPRVLQLFEERAYWLWLTAHRLADLRRLIRHYGFTEDEVFPVGQTIFGRPYGDDVNFPIPQIEDNNPNFSGQCIDRNA
ncbi:MAG TPA: hypothetical protein VF212_04855 [Longimicrobiales bacterium]